MNDFLPIIFPSGGPRRFGAYKPGDRATEKAPDQVANLTGWWDTYDPATLFLDAGVTQAGTTDPIYQMNDKSGNNRHWVQATAARRPINSGAGLTFDGINHGMGGLQIGDVVAADAKTLMIAFKTSAAVLSTLLFGDASGYWNFSTDSAVDTTWKTVNFDGASVYTVGITSINTIPLLYTHIHGGGNMDDQKNQQTPTAPVVSGNTTLLTSPIYLGGLFGTSIMFNGTFYGAATWNVAVSAADITEVQQWFFYRYGFS